MTRTTLSRAWLRAAGSLAILLVAPPAAPAQSELCKLTAIDAAIEDQFGFSLAMSGEYLIVGAPLGDKTEYSDSGAAYVFVREDARRWTEQAKLTPSAATSGDRFGGCVDISGPYAIVGAAADDHAAKNCGAAYVFKRSGSTWTEQAKLTAGDASEGDLFGFAVAIDGDCAVVGAYRDKRGRVETGSVYVFERRSSRWVQSVKLTPPGKAAQDWFGRSVAVSGDTIVVAATGDDRATEDAGAVFIYHRAAGAWSLQAVLTSDDARANDRFGRSVAIDGDRIIVGAFWHDEPAADSGAAYVFIRDGQQWTQQAKLTALNAGADDLFGISVDINGSYAVVGAIHQDESAPDAGAAYFFKRVGHEWIQPFRVTGSDAGAHDWFGFSVAIDGIYAAAGAIRDDDHGFDSGSVDVYSVVTIDP